MSVQNAFFKGYARIDLNHLSFDPMEHVDKARVKKYVKSFKKFGCKHDDILHAVPVIMDHVKLDIALNDAGLTRASLRDDSGQYPRLEFPPSERFAVLYGKYRLLAGKERLKGQNQWWTVSLYDSAITASERVEVLQGNHCPRHAPSDRDLATILNEHNRGNLDIWWEKMSETRCSAFTRLRTIDRGRLLEKIRELLSYRGLRHGLSGNWEQVLIICCYEEMYSYFDAILNTWKYILGNVDPSTLDESTVVELQLKSPAYSSSDCDAIESLFVEEKVFRFISDLGTREQIARRVLACKRIVSFQSFFQDFIYLKACHDGLRFNLLTNSEWEAESKSFKEIMSDHWNSKLVRNTRHNLERHKTFQYCYTDLWLSAQREFPGLSDGKSSRPLQGRAPISRSGVSHEVEMSQRKVQLAYRAYNRGFRTSRIEELVRKNPIEMTEDGPEGEGPCLTTHSHAQEAKGRANRPYQDAYDRDKKYLYPEYILDGTEMKTTDKKTYVTSFAIARDIVHCCWTNVKRWSEGPRTEDPNTAKVQRSASNKLRAKTYFKSSKPPRQRSFNFNTRHEADRASAIYREALAALASSPVPHTHLTFDIASWIGDGEVRKDLGDETMPDARDEADFEVPPLQVSKTVAVGEGGDSLEQKTDDVSLTSGAMATFHERVKRGLYTTSQGPSEILSDTSSIYSTYDVSEVEKAEEQIESEFDIFNGGSNKASDETDTDTQILTPRRDDTREDLETDERAEVGDTPQETPLERNDAFDTQIPGHAVLPHREENDLEQTGGELHHNIASTMSSGQVTTIAGDRGETISPRRTEHRDNSEETLMMVEPDATAGSRLPNLDEDERDEYSTDSNIQPFVLTSEAGSLAKSTDDPKASANIHRRDNGPEGVAAIPKDGVYSRLNKRMTWVPPGIGVPRKEEESSRQQKRKVGLLEEQKGGWRGEGMKNKKARR